MMKIALCAFALALIFLLGSVHGIVLTADQYKSLQSQIDGLNPGDTLLVINGSYHENIMVDRPIILRGIERPVIDGQGNRNAIILATGGAVLEGLRIINSSGEGVYVASDNNIIANNTVESCRTGISISNSSNNSIESNLITDNKIGIFLDKSKNNRIVGNNVSHNQGNGIYLLDSDNNICTENQASYNEGYGFYFKDSDSNVCSGNQADSNKYNGIDIENSSHNFFDNSSVRENAKNGFWLKRSYANNISRTIALHNDWGIALTESRNDSISGSISTNNKIGGMQIINSRNSTFIGNYLYNNSYDENNKGPGVYFSENHNNRIQGNNASSNSDDGFFIEKSTNNLILDNQANENREIGIRLAWLNNNTIMNNSAYHNIMGIALFNTSGNTIEKNRADNNSKGLSLEDGSNNIIIENILFKNGAAMVLLDSMKNRIENNSANNNNNSVGVGVALQNSSHNIILNNNIRQNRIGLFLNRSIDNSIGENSYDRNKVGIALNLSANNTIVNKTFMNNEYNMIINENETISAYPLWESIVLEEYPKNFLQPFDPYAKGSTPFYEIPPIHPVSSTDSSPLLHGSSSKRFPVYIDSDPEDAEIWIDGEKKTKTPNKIVLTKKGYYTIDLILSGYESVSEEVYVNQPITFYKKLIPVSPSKPEENVSDFYIMINSTPNGAIIWIDGKSTGMETPGKILLKDGEEHILGLTLLGYKEYTRKISSTRPSINVNLEPSVDIDSETTDEKSTSASIWLSFLSIIVGHYLYNRRKK